MRPGSCSGRFVEMGWFSGRGYGGLVYFLFVQRYWKD